MVRRSGVVLAAGMLVLGAACSRQKEATDVKAQAAKQGGLVCRVTGPSEVRVGEPLLVQFSLENRSDQTQQVLTWRTPLEGPLGNDWRITREGAEGEATYKGPMVKRGDPEAADYVPVPAGVSTESDVDLTLAYDLSTPGRYHIALRGGLMDVVPAGSPVPRKLAEFKSVPLACPALVVEVQAR